MAHGDRHNRCSNPALGVDLTGWSDSDGTLTRVTTTNPAFPRTYAAQSEGADYILSARGAVTPGVEYTFSVYAEADSDVGPSGATDTFIRFFASDGSSVASQNIGQWVYTAGAVTRISGDKTAPIGAAEGELLIETGGATMRLTACLIEETNALTDYADGNTPEWEWDGVAELSASRKTASSVVMGGFGGLRIGAHPTVLYEESFESPERTNAGYAYYQTPGVVTIDTGDAYTGSRSLLASEEDDIAELQYNSGGLTEYAVKVTPGKSYRAELQYKEDTPTMPTDLVWRLDFFAVNGGETKVGDTTEVALPPVTDWTGVQTPIIVAPADADLLDWHFDSTTGADSRWRLDMVRFVETDTDYGAAVFGGVGGLTATGQVEIIVPPGPRGLGVGVPQISASASSVTKRGDTTPWTFSATDKAGNPVDLTIVSSLRLLGSRSGSITIDTLVTGDADGVVVYTPTTTNVDKTGTMHVEVEATYPDGTVVTYPTSGFGLVHIQPDLG